MDRADRGAFGTLLIRVQPADAEVLVDGERWERPEGDPRLRVEVSEGTHRIEIRKNGFKPYTSTVRVGRGETSQYGDNADDCTHFFTQLNTAKH